MATSAAIQTEALDRARHGESVGNYPTIIRGFKAAGIPESDIHPRENVFTYQAWRKLRRQVRRGERGIRIVTYIRREKTADDGTKSTFSRPWSATVFHVTQTDPIMS